MIIRLVFKNIYSAVPGLSCGTQDLGFLLWHVESSSLISDGNKASCTESEGS